MAQTETQAAAPENAADATENNSTTAEATGAEPVQETEDISYHAVEKDGQVTAIWEMQGRKHLRTIDPRSSEGKNILSLFTSEHHDEETTA
jgi:hypothetical protein